MNQPVASPEPPVVASPAGRLQRFTVVGLVATAVDVAVLLWLIRHGHSEVFYADLASVSIASVVSYGLHRIVTLGSDPSRRWYELFAGSYASTVLGSLAVDVVVFTALMDRFGSTAVAVVLAVKAVSVVAAVLVRRTAYRSILGGAIRADQARPRARLALDDRPLLSVVVPAFEEADRIADTVAEIREQTARTSGGIPLSVEVVVVDDGSSDGTAAAAAAAGADTVVQLPANRGKGAAVRTGMLAATGQVRAFIDADLAYSPDQLLLLLDEVLAGWDVVVGNRRHSSTTTLVRTGLVRNIGSRVVNALTSLALLGAYRDTQCGLKAFSAASAERIFSVTHVDRFAMDIEVLYVVERLQMSLCEVPVRVTNSTRSTVRVVRDTLRLLRDVVRIRILARSGTYDVAAPAVQRHNAGLPDSQQRK